MASVMMHRVATIHRPESARQNPAQQKDGEGENNQRAKEAGRLGEMLHGAIATEPLIGEERDGTVKPKHTDDHRHANADEGGKPDAKSRLQKAFCAFDRHSWTPMRDLHLIGGCVIEDHVSQPAVAVVRGHDVYPN